MFGVGWTEILVILVVALLVLGPKKLPDIARGLGKGIRDFRKAMNGLDDEPQAPRPPAWTGPALPANPPPPGSLPAPLAAPDPSAAPGSGPVAALPPAPPATSTSAGDPDTRRPPE